MTPLVLASASPARLRTLRDAGLAAEVVVSGVDEDALTATAPGVGTAGLVQLLASAKARAVAATRDDGALVLGCDSMLDLDGEALGKPGSAEDAAARWRRMRGRTGVLHTGHCLVDTATDRCEQRAVATEVRFADVDDDEIAAYCSSGEPATVAGAFTVDGLGGWFVTGINGDHHNVVGLSLPVLRVMVRALGHTLADLGYPPVR